MTEIERPERIAYRNPIKRLGWAQVYHVLTLDTDLSDGAFRLYSLLLKYARQAGSCYPGIERMSLDLDRGKRTVARHLSELVERGLVTREQRAGTSAITYVEDLETVYNDIHAKNGMDTMPKMACKEESVKKKYDNNDNGKRTHLEQLFSNEIGEVTPGVRERLAQLLEEYPDLVRWAQAFDAVVSSGVRRLDYLTACLESDGKPRWSRPR